MGNSEGEKKRHRTFPDYPVVNIFRVTRQGGEPVGVDADWGVSVPFCSLAFLDPRVDHTMDVLSLFISKYD